MDAFICLNGGQDGVLGYGVTIMQNQKTLKCLGHGCCQWKWKIGSYSLEWSAQSTKNETY